MNRRERVADLLRHLHHATAEAQRFHGEILGGLEVCALPAGETPDRDVCADVRAERSRLRDFEKRLVAHAARLRGAP